MGTREWNLCLHSYCDNMSSSLTLFVSDIFFTVFLHKTETLLGVGEMEVEAAESSEERLEFPG